MSVSELIARLARKAKIAKIDRCDYARYRELMQSILDTGEDKDKIVAAKAILSSLGPISELAELRARLDRLERSRRIA